MTESTASASTDRRDPYLVAGLGLLLMGAMVPLLGVWEPWEADQVAVVDTMRATGQWLRVQLPAGGDTLRAVPDLPYGWWPLAASTGLLGVNELGLRLPDVLAAVGCLVLLFLVTRRFFGRLTGWLAALSLLCMPLFIYQGRFALGSGLEMSLIGLACLAFLRVSADDEASAAWRHGAWVATAAAALVSGLTGLLAPLATAVTVIIARSRAEGASPSALTHLRRVAPPLSAVLASVAIIGGWVQAAVVLADGMPVEALFLWTDLLDGVLRGGDRPSFDLFVHQIGFGLFPLGALVPFAFAEALWHPPRDDEPIAAGWVFTGAAAWFGVGFLVPAAFASYSHFALFLAAPAVALVVGVYLGRILRSPPQPLLVLGAILVLALLDSNLKHETRLLADTVVGGEVDAFPAKLTWWRPARFLSMALLGVLLLYQGGVHRWGTRFVRLFAYPKVPRPLFDWAIMLATFPLPYALWFKKSHLAKVISYSFWGNLTPNARRAVVGLAAWAVAYFIVRALYNWRVAQVSGREGGRLSAAVDRLAAVFDRAYASRYAMVGVLAVWAVFLNLPLARALTTNFSQKGLLSRYDALAVEQEPLYRYRLTSRNSSFYARDLPELDRGAFAEQSKGEARFFAIIPRDRLAAINTEFRRIARRTLPVLDDRGSRFLLVSNLVRDGEEDLNPINSALIDGLPPGATKLKEPVNFEKKIELVGWQLDPPEPSPGAPLEIVLFWRALTDSPGSWKVFVHIDAAGQRIHGDHDPVEGLFPSKDWRKGDLIRDAHDVVVKRTISAATFTFYAGLFRGSTRMKIESGPKDRENRAKLGRIRVR